MKHWWVAVGCAVALAPGRAQDNLLLNPGFETLAAPGRAAEWSFSGGGKAVQDAKLAHSGEVCVRVRFEDHAAQTIAVTAGEWYLITGFCRAEKADTKEVPRVKLWFHDADGKQITQGGGFIYGVDAAHWQPFEISFTSPPGTAQVRVAMIGQFQGEDWFYFDDVGIKHIPVKDRPAIGDVPPLQGKTVVVADRADVVSYALYRVPSGWFSPIDGVLSSAGWTGRSPRITERPPTCDFDLSLGRPTPVSWALIHALNPLRPVGQASLTIGPRQVELTDDGAFVHSVRIPRAERTDQVRLRIHGADRRTAEVNEIQLFDVVDGVSLPGQAVELKLGGELSEAERADAAGRFPNTKDRAFVVAGGAGGGQPLALDNGHPASLVARLGDQPVGVRGVALELALAAAERDTLLEVALRECVELDLDYWWATLKDRRLSDADKRRPRADADVFRIFVPVRQGATSLSVAFDVPDRLLAAGEPLWLDLRADQPLTVAAQRSQVRVATCAPKEAAAEYAPLLERVVRRLYTCETEAHPYGATRYQGSVLHRYVERLLELDPDNAAGTIIFCAIANRLPLVEVKRPGPASAPDWAVWGRHAQREWTNVVKWWIAHRWIASGELGGDLNDDVEYSCNWPLAYLITGDEALARAQRAIADAVWVQSGGSGYNIVATDVEHAAEDSSCSLPQMMLCEFGNPVHVERMMAMSRHIPFWTGVNEKGRRQFKSYVFNTKMVGTKPKEDIDHLYCALAMVGATHLTWYNAHPLTSQWTAEYAQSWAEAGMSDAKGKPVGVLPCDIKYSTGEPFPYTDRWDRSVYYSFGHYVMNSLLIGAEFLGLDAGPALKPMVQRIVGDEAKAIADTKAYLDRVAQVPEPLPGKRYCADGTWRPMGAGSDAPYRAALATGDRAVLVRYLEEMAREMERTRFLVTEAEPYTDRVHVTGGTFLRHMFLGGDVAGKTHVPGLAVSWENGGTDFAALVLRADETSLKALVYGFFDAPRDMALRVWRLRRGNYDVRVGYDDDGDDRIDREVSKSRQLLRRHSRVPFRIEPNRVLVVEFTGGAAPAAAKALPDLALSADDLKVVDGKLQVTVHNLGLAPATGATVELLDAAGKVVAKQSLPTIPAPLDLQPKTATVTFPTTKATTVRLLPATDDTDQVPENNTLKGDAP